jgi:hypothetical protein
MKDGPSFQCGSTEGLKMTNHFGYGAVKSRRSCFTMRLHGAVS